MISLFFYFLLALILLIAVHEYGHFIVARIVGVKVLRFSFGFGKVLAKWEDKRGTEFAVSLIPLGGYVKMLDESEGEVKPEELHLAYNNQPIWKRIAIVLAGPVFNLIFAFFAIWVSLVIGMKSLAPIVDKVQPGSVAAQAGLQPHQEIISFNNNEILSWHDFQYRLMPLIGTSNPVEVSVKSLNGNTISHLMLPLGSWKFDTQEPDVLKTLGITPFVPSIPPIVNEIVPNSPADKMGFAKNDKVLTINDQPISEWVELFNFVKKHPNAAISFKIDREGQSLTLKGHLGANAVQNEQLGFLGIKPAKVTWPNDWLRIKRLGFFEAGFTAFKQTTELTSATFKIIGRLIIGNIPLQSLSGPVGIAQGAGESGRSGFPYYLYFLALVSVSLGVLNVLPIPVLDGGHILYLLIEWVRRKPLSEGVKSTGMYIGMVLLLALMVLGVSNDINRLGN